ncbi:hypothetical protein MXB_5092, partial [Myxobolus squamalis]
MSLCSFAILVFFFQINNFLGVLTDTIYCVDTFSHLKYKAGNVANEFQNGTEVDSRHGCCNDDDTLCLIFDPCLTIGENEKQYTAFLRGYHIKPHILAPFYSNFTSN